MKLYFFLSLILIIANIICKNHGLKKSQLRSEDKLQSYSEFYQNQRNQQVVINNPKSLGCVACRFIWENVESALGQESRNSVLAAESFQNFCKISPDLFFNPCNQMFDGLYGMSENFAKKLSVKELCIRAAMCDSNMYGENPAIKF